MKADIKSLLTLARPLIMAHRGDQTGAPENTLSALAAAYELGIDIIETDIRMTRDNELVLFHNKTLDGTTNLSGPVRNYTLNELKKADLGHGQKIPTLKEVFSIFPQANFNLDIKDQNSIAPCLLARLIEKYNRQSSVIVASFHYPQIKRFRALMPQVPTSAATLEVVGYLLLRWARLSRRLWHPEYRFLQIPMTGADMIPFTGFIKVVNADAIRQSREHNIGIHVWTINERIVMERLIGMGVDGIFTDDPGLLKKVLAEKKML